MPTIPNTSSNDLKVELLISILTTFGSLTLVWAGPQPVFWLPHPSSGFLLVPVGWNRTPTGWTVSAPPYLWQKKKSWGWSFRHPTHVFRRHQKSLVGIPPINYFPRLKKPNDAMAAMAPACPRPCTTQTKTWLSRHLLPSPNNLQKRNHHGEGWTIQWLHTSLTSQKKKIIIWFKHTPSQSQNHSH